MSALLLGLFGGIGATVLWELILKPARERRSIAEVVAAEVSINMQLLTAAQVMGSARKVPPDFAASTMVFDGIVSSIGQLPPAAIREVVFLYRYFHELNRIPAKYVEYVNDLRQVPKGHKGQHDQVQREIDSCVNVFNSYVDKAITRANITQPLLLKSALPWWSLRRWQHGKSKTLSIDEAAQRVSNASSHRADLADRILRKEQGE